MASLATWRLTRRINGVRLRASYLGKLVATALEADRPVGGADRKTLPHDPTRNAMSPLMEVRMRARYLLSAPALVLALASTTAGAQSVRGRCAAHPSACEAARDRRDVRLDHRELRGDKRELRADRRDLRQDDTRRERMRDRRDLTRDARDYRSDRRDLRLDRRDLRRDRRPGT